MKGSSPRTIWARKGQKCYCPKCDSLLAILSRDVFVKELVSIDMFEPQQGLIGERLNNLTRLNCPQCFAPWHIEHFKIARKRGFKEQREAEIITSTTEKLEALEGFLKQGWSWCYAMGKARLRLNTKDAVAQSVFKSEKFKQLRVAYDRGDFETPDNTEPTT